MHLLALYGGHFTTQMTDFPILSYTSGPFWMEPPRIKIKNRPLYPLGPCQGDGYGVRQLQILI